MGREKKRCVRHWGIVKGNLEPEAQAREAVGFPHSHYSDNLIISSENHVNK